MGRLKGDVLRREIKEGEKEREARQEIEEWE